MAESRPDKPWPRTWTWAVALAVLVFGAHGTTYWWLTALMRVLFGEIQTAAAVPPRAWAILACYLLLSLFAGLMIANLCTEGSLARDRHRWQQEQAQRRQLWDLEQQIREEALPEGERERRRQHRQRQAEIKAEARRRLALPEEEDPK